jgi:hypothetical protein
VDLSFTSTRATILSSALPLEVVISTFSKKPSALTRALETLMAVWL